MKGQSEGSDEENGLQAQAFNGVVGSGIVATAMATAAVIAIEGDDDEEQEGDGEVDEEERDEQEVEEGERLEEEGQQHQRHYQHHQSTKLAEGFYEIEAVRRKRVRKGQLQYYIKWRGWPETANTWEPLENLQSCSDIIDAFEENLRLQKTASRRRKRKYGVPHTQSKKKQEHQHQFFSATDIVRTVKHKILGESLNSSSFTNDVRNPSHHDIGTADQCCEQGSANVNFETQVRKEDNELDTTLKELVGTMATEELNVNKFYPQGKASKEDVIAEGLSKVDSTEPIQTSRCIGAKRRKSGSVKRFKQELAKCEQNDAQDAAARNGACSRVQLLGIANSAILRNDLPQKNKFDDPANENAPFITQIIKPISYSASVSNSVQDVLVTFMALRSDGKQVMVENKYLKANNPLLLINFYEQHLRYSPTP